jgi:hypothetical protein
MHYQEARELSHDVDTSKLDPHLRVIKEIYKNYQERHHKPEWVLGNIDKRLARCILECNNT